MEYNDFNKERSADKYLLEEGFKPKKISVQWATWAITDYCNASPLCYYCIQGQGKKDAPSKHPNLRIIYSIIDGLATLKDQWNISLMGGEVFSIPEFSTSILPYFLKHTQHKASMTTNFVIENTELKKLLSTYPKERLTEIRFSYHYALWPQPQDFIYKLNRLVVSLSNDEDKKRIKIPILLVPSQLDFIQKTLTPWLISNNIKFYYQMMKQYLPDRVIPFNYSKRHMRQIRMMLGKKEEGDLVVSNNSYTGQSCFAGSRLLAIKSNGDVYMCYNAIDEDYTMGFLGNITSADFRLMEKPVSCPFNYCSCGAADYSRNSRIEVESSGQSK